MFLRPFHDIYNRRRFWFTTLTLFACMWTFMVLAAWWSGFGMEIGLVEFFTNITVYSIILAVGLTICIRLPDLSAMIQLHGHPKPGGGKTPFTPI